MHGGFSLGQQWSALNPYDYEEVDVGAVAIGLTAGKLLGCQAVWIRFSGGDVRFRVDSGGVPTAGFGNPAFDGDREPLSRAEASNFQAIRVGTTNGRVHATYYR